MHEAVWGGTMAQTEPGAGTDVGNLKTKAVRQPYGTLGKRNDYTIGAIEEKMGLHGSATCVINLGDNGDCYAELLGTEHQGMKVMFQMMNEARIGVGLQSLSSASIAYFHALKYAKERLQGSSLLEMKNPEAPRVPIIQHPDVRRMLLWMKAHTDGFRALLYFYALCGDRLRAAADEAEFPGSLILRNELPRSKLRGIQDGKERSKLRGI
jgi:alkylation response protein AidB-like acyl-CoA dehydrogenase